MRILQSTVEKLLYILLFLMFIGIILVGTVAYDDGQQIKRIINNHSQSIAAEEQATQQIKANQATNSNAIKQYIACLIAINPTGNVQAQEQTCFDKAPEVK